KGARQARGAETARRRARDGPRCEGKTVMMVLLLLASLIPQQVLIATPRGQASIPVSNETGAAAVASVLLARPLGLKVSLAGPAPTPTTTRPSAPATAIGRSKSDHGFTTAPYDRRGSGAWRHRPGESRSELPWGADREGHHARHWEAAPGGAGATRTERRPHAI